MFHRFAVMFAGIALAAGSVAPAKVASAAAIPTPAAPSTDALPTTIPAVLTQPEAPLGVQPEVTAPDIAAPAVSRSESLAEKVADLRASDAGSRELECLAAGVYFEAKSEPLTGQLAVGRVIANRADSHGRFPSSYCGVLLQRGQFSFIRGGRWPAVNRNGAQWKTAVAIARIIHGDLHDSPVKTALFFHARSVAPSWRMVRVGAVGNHVFYR
ncbi:cell wall hydrolase [Sphingomonas sp. BN140010]|uniref:Cell wall hydrolase n=1 Tax=Sphingomonas arvum TaxID=2992113 RepID=A0ABT3JF90_9SPHN|nr:cell wall hydrolase [Sphingomonas sp. BN140010]MCW3797745.1 cell wall hydrolase [Sphingomonas sp. BN140010]